MHKAEGVKQASIDSSALPPLPGIQVFGLTSGPGSAEGRDSLDLGAHAVGFGQIDIQVCFEALGHIGQKADADSDASRTYGFQAFQSCIQPKIWILSCGAPDFQRYSPVSHSIQGW